MIEQKNKIPVGAFTLLMAAVALALHFWPKAHCDTLEKTLNNGFFMRWQPPELLIILANKQQLSFSAQSKKEACLMALDSITENQSNTQTSQ